MGNPPGEIGPDLLASGRPVGRQTYGGRSVAIDQSPWHRQAGLACFSEKRPELLNNLLTPFETEIGRVLSNVHHSWYQEAAEFIGVISEVAPDYTAHFQCCRYIRG